jgi:hypothetical protein
MLTAVWAAVVAAAVAFVIGMGVAVYVMLKAARLMTERSAALASLTEREDLLAERAGTALDQVGEQIAMTESITATMDDVTAGLAELRGRISGLTPAAPAAPAGPAETGAAAWTAALVYGVARALGLRWTARRPARPGHPAEDSVIRHGPGARQAAAAPVSGSRPPRLGGSRPSRVGGPRPPRVSRPWPERVSEPRPAWLSQRRAALTGRRGGSAP